MPSVTAMMLAFAVPVMASPLSLLQDAQPPVKVDVHTTESHTVWYTDPMWLAIGGLVLLLVIVLAVMAGRGDRGTTTVVR
ncbi:MAG TPA: hypothetical protein VE967_02940 [Gemmatimonadaceae bacterium]|nr:hypothetical protein [Gemmatimonadaceae bacterium]